MKKIGLVLLGISSITFGGNCTDFSGNWVGSCTTTGAGTQDDAFSVTQTGCEKVGWGEIEIEMGKDVGYTETLETHDEKISMRADWDTTKATFTLKYTIVATQKTGAPLYTLKGTLEPKIVSGKLLSSHDAEYTPAGAGTQTTKTNCRYSKR